MGSPSWKENYQMKKAKGVEVAEMKQTKDQIQQFEVTHKLKVVSLIVKDTIDTEKTHDVIKFFRDIPPWSNVLLILHIPEGGSADECSR